MSNPPSTNGKGDKWRPGKPGAYEAGYDAIDWKRPPAQVPNPPLPAYNLAKTLDQMKSSEQIPTYRFVGGGTISG